MTTAKEPLTGPSLSPPPCSAEHPQDRDLSKDSTTNVTQHRCQFTYSDGRRCSNERAPLCAHHAAKQKPDFGAVGAPDAALEGLCSDLTTATNINRALAHVFLLTAQGRISQKQAVAFGYLSQLLLQTVPGIRSEFVSAFGYAPWESNLKSKLTMRPGFARESHGDQELSPVHEVELSPANEDPDNSGPGGETPQQPLDKPIVDRRPFEERVVEPDYDSIVSRGRDLLAGKYSVTPEGRREAQTLNTELELMKPPAAKMPKGARASIIEHMKRWIAQKKVTMRPASSSRPPAKVYPPAGESHGHQELSPVHEVELSPVNSSRESLLAANVYQQDELRGVKEDQELSRVNKVNVREGPFQSSAPPALNYYGHPIPMAVPYDEIKRGARPASRTPRDAQITSRTPSRAADFATPTPSRETSPPTDKLSPPPNSEISNIKSPVVPVSPPSSRPSAPALSSDRPPTRRPKKPRSSTQVPAPEPSPRPSPPAFATELDLTAPNRTAHATDWYTPPAWSKNRASDPFPSRNEKRKRELRGMSNSKLRHLQHLNSRAF